MKRSKHSIFNSILLTIGVLLLAVLVLGQLNKKRVINVKKEKALLALKAEVENNRHVLDIWIQWENQISAEIDTLIDATNNDETFEGRLPIKLTMYEPRTISTNRTLNTLNDGAWRALRNSKMLPYFDFNTVYALEKLYGSQESLIDLFNTIPLWAVNSSLDRKITNMDNAKLYELRLFLSKVMLQQSYVDNYFNEVFNLPEFRND